MIKEYQTYLKDCGCDSSGLILYKGLPVCRWCRVPYAEGGMMQYDDEHFKIEKPELMEGDPVHVITPQGRKQNGIIKGFHNLNKEFAFVVYSCDNNWDNYKDYTGQLTDVKALKPGWALEQGKVGKIKYIVEAFSMQPITMTVAEYSKEDEAKLSHFQILHSIKKILLERLQVGGEFETFYCGYNYHDQRVFQFLYKSVNVGYFPESLI